MPKSRTSHPDRIKKLDFILFTTFFNVVYKPFNSFFVVVFSFSFFYLYQIIENFGYSYYFLNI